MFQYAFICCALHATFGIVTVSCLLKLYLPSSVINFSVRKLILNPFKKVEKGNMSLTLVVYKDYVFNINKVSRDFELFDRLHYFHWCKCLLQSSLILHRLTSINFCPCSLAFHCSNLYTVVRNYNAIGPRSEVTFRYFLCSKRRCIPMIVDKN